MRTLVVNEVLENLEAQGRLYRRLLDLSQAQLVAVRDGDVRSVHALLQEIEMEMLNRAGLERRRADALGRAASELGVQPHEVTASRIAELGEPEVARRLQNCSRELGTLVAELDGVVARNRALLEQELALIHHVVDGITVAERSPTYGRPGASPAQRGGEVVRRQLLDMQV